MKSELAEQFFPGRDLEALTGQSLDQILQFRLIVDVLDPALDFVGWGSYPFPPQVIKPASEARNPKVIEFPGVGFGISLKKLVLQL